MSDLAEFLLARIAEGEADAHENDPLPSGAVFDHDVSGWWDTARVLAECEAKRRIVGAWDLHLSEPDPELGWPGGDPLGGQAAELFYDILKLLALPYADHPDYRAEWRP